MALNLPSVTEITHIIKQTLKTCVFSFASYNYKDIFPTCVCMWCVRMWLHECVENMLLYFFFFFFILVCRKNQFVLELLHVCSDQFGHEQVLFTEITISNFAWFGGPMDGNIFIFLLYTCICTFFATFCTVHSALDLARDHAPQKWPLLSLLVLINSLKSSTTISVSGFT